MTRRIMTAACLVGTAILWLHLIHVVAGHKWFAVYGPILGLALSIGGAFLACPLAIDEDGSGRWRRVAAAAALLVLLVVPEWLEGEVASGHALDAATLADHGWSTVLALGAALTLASALEARRVLRALRGY